jgi:serine/threonine protein kinase/tetratricopeptide (TPR) repeat protein
LSDVNLELPHRFGRYVLTQVVGEGGMAEVYLAHVRVAEGLQKRVVVKKIRREYANSPEFTRMFVDEAKIALSLNHANLVQVFDFGQVRGDLYLAMELVEGIDLMRLFRAVHRAGDTFPPVIAAYLAHQVAAGLAYAHRKGDDFGTPLGIVHRDVSPHNVMVSFEGQVKILDFGIARTRNANLDPLAEVDPSERYDEAETIKGKVAYMSPEQANGRPVDARSDVYSLGVVLHELISGTLLFRTKDRLAALDLVRSQPIPPIREVAPDCPDPLAAIVDRALARDPEGRYESARAMQADLATYLHRADPVVDDEVLSNFIAQYHRAEPHAPAPTTMAGRNADDESQSRDRTPAPPRPSRRQQRVVVVLVALDPEARAAGERPPNPRRFVSLVRDVAFKREATVLRADDQAIVLAFGAELRTGDDAARALRTALALREDAAESAPGLRLGFVVGNAAAIIQRGEGQAVHVKLRPGVGEQLEHVARRFMEGAVMVSGNLVESLSSAWRFGASAFVEPVARAQTGSVSAIDRELEHIAPLLGPATPEPRVQSVPGGRTLVLGRELELKTLRDVFSDAIRTRRARAVLVLGEPGMGKRALVERFVASLPRTACWVLRAAGSWSRRNVPFGVFLDLLGRFLEVDHRTGPDQIAERLAQYGVEETPLLARALAHALGGAGPDVAADPEQRRDRLYRLVRRLVTSLAQRRPVLVIIENIHVHDEASLGLLREWIQHPQPFPILGLVTGRPGNRRVETVRREPLVTEILLGELDEQARRDLIVRRFEDPKAAEVLADAILSHTGGNPLFIEQTLAALLERGVVAWSASGRYLTIRQPGAAVALPPSIEVALAERIADLPRGDREVLQAAAILGRNFRVDELAALLDRDVGRSLDNLIERAFVEPIGRLPATSPGETHRVSTVSLFEACRASIPAAAAVGLHGRAAQLRRDRPDYRPERDDGPIADHLIAGGRGLEAVDPALRAAEVAKGVGGNVEAYYHLSQALRALTLDDPRRFEALLDRERILRAWGRRRAQGADVRQLLRSAEQLADPARHAIAWLRLFRFYLEVGRTALAERLVPRVETAVDAAPSPRPLRATFHELHSELLLARGQFDEARRTAQEGLTLCGEDDAGRRQRAQLLARLGHVQLTTGHFEDSRTSFERMLEIAEALEDSRLTAEALNRLGEVAGRSTRYQEAVDYFTRALDIDRDLGDRFATGRKLANLGMAFSAIGLYHRAERYLRKALELHEAVGHPAEFNDVIVHLGEVVASLGHLDSARSLLLDAARVAVTRGDVRTELRARVRLARALVDHGESDDDLASAKLMAEQVLATARGQGLRTARRRALSVLSKLARRAGAPQHAIELEREAVELVEAGADPIDGVRSIYHLGQLLTDHGDPAEGKAYLRRAAVMVRERLADLRDEQLRKGYLDQPDAQAILADGEDAGQRARPELS